jgi:hypothetical protein
MLLCHRGCGLEATFTNNLGKPCCFPKAPSCPIIKKKIGEESGASRKGKTYEELHGDNADAMRKKRSEGLTGRPVSEKSREKSSNSNKKHRELNPRDPWNKGKTGVQTPWNKGKTGYSMPPRRKISEQDYQDYQKYKRAVYSASRKTYNQNINVLNPNGVLLGRSGIPGAYQIDHRVPVSLGYQLKIPVTVMSIVENLQLMPWKANLNKSNKHIANEEILNTLLERTK